jgi:hypothetical protein
VTNRLNSFQSTHYDEVIEIPGQYTGLSPPHEQPTSIVRFDQRVLVMSSIRKPKRICIIGSDEREYLFLVKVRFVMGEFGVLHNDPTIHVHVLLVDLFDVNRVERTCVLISAFNSCSV